MITVSVLGSGNVAQHLVAAFGASDEIVLHQVWSRHPLTFDLPIGSMFIDTLDRLDPADIYIIAVSDSAVAALSKKLPFENRLVVHTAGSLPLTEINPRNRRGVFYPLQTFSKSKSVDFKNVPLCLETELASDYSLLEGTARAVSEHIYQIGFDQRKSLHIAAVFVNNFPNHLYVQAARICEQHQVPFEILKPLIRETADKVMTIPPIDAQTGPALRDDQNTIQSHIESLSDPTQIEIYKLLTQSIQENGKKL